MQISKKKPSSLNKSSRLEHLLSSTIVCSKVDEEPRTLHYKFYTIMKCILSKYSTIILLY